MCRGHASACVALGPRRSPESSSVTQESAFISTSPIKAEPYLYLSRILNGLCCVARLKGAVAVDHCGTLSAGDIQLEAHCSNANGLT